MLPSINPCGFVAFTLQCNIIEIRRTNEFTAWVRGLSDEKARAKVFARIDRLRAGNPGDVKPVGQGVSEMRIDHGPGYRVYFAQRGLVLVLLLCGGTKSTQEDDIATAKALAEQWKE